MYNILGKSAYWVVNKRLARYVGLEEVLFLSDLIDKHHYFKGRGETSEDDYFFNTVDIIQEDIGLTYRKQKRVISNLIAKNIITTRLQGLPTKLYFKINYGEIKKLLEVDEFKKKEIKIAKVRSTPSVKYKDEFKTKEKLAEAVQSIYATYPSKCIVKNSTTGKSQSSKLKIAKLLKEHTTAELLKVVKWYVNECKTSNVYMKNFNTFLNNLPDMNEGDDVEDVENKNEIIKLVKWLSSNYMMKEPDVKSDEKAKKLAELGYKNHDFLNQFLL